MSKLFTLLTVLGFLVQAQATERIAGHKPLFYNSITNVKTLEISPAGLQKKSTDLLNEISCQNTDSTGNNGKNDSKGALVYDSMGKILEQTDYRWKGGKYKEDFHYSYAYDSIARLSALTIQVWDSLKGKWVDKRLESHYYDAATATETVLYRTFKGTVLLNDTRITYGRTGTGLDSTMFLEHWISGKWIPSEKMIHSYDGNGRMTTHQMLMWNTKTSSLENYMLITLNYNAQGQLVTQWEQVYDSSISGWMDMAVDTFVYNPAGMIDYTMRSMLYGNMRMFDSRMGYTYDATGNVTRQYARVWQGTAWTNDFIAQNTFDSRDNKTTAFEKYWDISTGKLNVASKCQYTYTIFTGTADAAQPATNQNISLYPQPAADKLNIRLAGNKQQIKVGIYTLTGQLLYSTSLPTGENNIDVQSYKPGLYILKWQSGAANGTMKWIKE